MSTESGQYDSCGTDRFYLGTNSQALDPWDDGNLYVQTGAVFDHAVAPETITSYLENRSLLFP